MGATGRAELHRRFEIARANGDNVRVDIDITNHDNLGPAGRGAENYRSCPPRLHVAHGRRRKPDAPAARTWRLLGATAAARLSQPCPSVSSAAQLDVSNTIRCVAEQATAPTQTLPEDAKLPGLLMVRRFQQGAPA